MPESPNSRREAPWLILVRYAIGFSLVALIMLMLVGGVALVFLWGGNSLQPVPVAPVLAPVVPPTDAFLLEPPTVVTEIPNDWPNLAINWETGVSSITVPADILPVDDLPTAETLRVEIVRLEALPEAKFNPVRVLAPGEATDITFPSSGIPGFWLYVKFDDKSPSPKITVTAKIDYKRPGLGPRTFKVNEAQRMVAALAAEQQRLILAGAAPATVNVIKKKLAELAKLNVLYSKTRNGRAKIHYRIYTIDGDREQTLFQSDEPAGETPPDNKVDEEQEKKSE